MIRVRGFPTPAGLLDLDVEPGEVVLLRGPNGSGKTSLLRAIAGLPGPRAPAQARLGGEDPAGLPAARLAQAVAFSPQDARDGLVGLTVRGEWRLRGLPGPPAPPAWAHRDVATLSSGESRRLGLHLASARAAPVLLLDEPAEGLDDGSRRHLRGLVSDAARRGAVVAVDHSGLLDDLATRVVELGEPSEGASAAPFAQAAEEGHPVVESPPVLVRAGSSGLSLPRVALPPGFHALSGPNGSGKSTLLLRLCGVGSSEGVRVAGRAPEPGRLARLALPRARDALRADTVRQELENAQDWVVDELVPAALLDRHPFALSGGEAQRVGLAKALGPPVPFYGLDEPEAHLDAQGRAALFRVISKRIDEGACVLAATHDPVLLRLARRTIRLEASP